MTNMQRYALGCVTENTLNHIGKMFNEGKLYEILMIVTGYLAAVGELEEEGKIVLNDEHDVDFVQACYVKVMDLAATCIRAL